MEKHHNHTMMKKKMNENKKDCLFAENIFVFVHNRLSKYNLNRTTCLRLVTEFMRVYDDCIV